MIRDLLFGEHANDIYKGIEPADPVELLGWTDHREHFARLIPPDAKVILEVGCWYGRSTAMFAELAPRAEIVAMDTWLGSSEFYLDKNDSRNLHFRNGRAGVYERFLANMVALGFQDRVTPFPISSTAGLEVLRRLKVRPDVVYIDAGHSYRECLQDIDGALRLEPRLLTGDDYCPVNWPGVVEAVDDSFGKTVNLETGSFWWVRLTEDEYDWVEDPAWEGAKAAVCPNCKEHIFFTLNAQGQRRKMSDEGPREIDPAEINPSVKLGLKMKRRILAAKRRALSK